MKRYRLILFALALIATGCYSTEYAYQSEKTKGTDFSKYRTYAWLATKDTAYTKLVNKKNVEKMLATVVKLELDKRGMKMDTLNPDCLFTYTLVMNKTYDVGDAPPQIYSEQTYAPAYPGQNQIYYYRADYGLPTYSGGMQVTTFRDGSLVIDMIDRLGDKVIWRSTVQGKQNEEDRKGVRATINDIVPKMFKKFPVKNK
jgi:Domain of unknown function (DUF4136)